MTTRRTLLHLSPVANRASIAAHGLDPRRMGAAPGLANSERRELDGVYVWTDRADAEWWAGMQTVHPALDLWEIDDPGSVLQTGPHGYDYLPLPVPPERVRLVETFPAAPEQPARTTIAGVNGAVVTGELFVADDEEAGESPPA